MRARASTSASFFSILTLTLTLNIVLFSLFIKLQITSLTERIMRIEKSVEIRKPSSEVFNYLKYTRNQDNFSVWNMADPNMKKEQSGTDGEVGFLYRWNSQNKNVGAGEQEITSIIHGKRIDSALRFFRPMKNTGKTSFLIDDAGNGLTRVNGSSTVHRNSRWSFSPLSLKRCLARIWGKAS